jgi:hypothetical protein
MIEALASQSYVASHMYWRYCFLRATKMKPPEKSIYYQRWEDVVERKGIFRLLDEPFYDDETGKLSKESEEQMPTKVSPRREEPNTKDNLKEQEGLRPAPAELKTTAQRRRIGTRGKVEVRRKVGESGETETRKKRRKRTKRASV